jgi:hypothetical protein
MIARSSIIVGPARIVRDTGTPPAGTVHVREPFSIELVKSQFPVVVDGYGEIESRDEDMIATCSFTPDGRWDAATRSFLWPHSNPTIGSDPFGATDVPTEIHASNSNLHTLRCTAVTTMPSLRLSTTGSMVGNATITAIRGSAKDWNDTSSNFYLYAASGGTFADATFTKALIKNQHYTGAFGSVTGLTAIQTQDGWTVDFETGIEFIKIDEVGTCKAVLTSVKAMAKCTPIGLSASDVIAAIQFQETTSARGASGTQVALTITGSDSNGGSAAVVTIHSAKLVTGGFRFGSNVVRDGELGFVSTRVFTSGIPSSPVFTLA